MNGDTIEDDIKNLKKIIDGISNKVDNFTASYLPIRNMQIALYDLEKSFEELNKCMELRKIQQNKT